MRKIELIDFLKGYSIFTIVFFHYLKFFNMPAPFDKLICFGGTGVHLFILLSGFGLYLSYLNKPETYASYLKRRFGKVYIPYIIAVLITVAISLIVPIYHVSFYSIMGHVFLFKMFDETIVGTYGYPLWFISMIFQFYLVFYFIVYLKKKVENMYFIAICLMISISWAILVMALNKGPVRVWNSFFLQYLWEFAIGMVLASFVYNKNNIKFNLKAIYILGIALISCALYGYLALLPGGIGKLFNDIPALIGYSFLGIWIYNLKYSFIKSFLLFTGKISFSLYLLHISIFASINVIFKELPLPLVLVVSIAISYILSFYYQQALNPVYKRLKI